MTIGYKFTYTKKDGTVFHRVVTNRVEVDKAVTEFALDTNITAFTYTKIKNTYLYYNNK